MKPFIPYSLLAAAAACGMAFGQAYTTPVGYVSLGNTTPEMDAVPAATEITFSVPLVQASSFVGTAASATDTVLTSDQVLESGAFNAPESGNPYLLEIKTGAGSGIYLPIISNTENTITVATGNGDDLSDIVDGDEFAIREAWTLSTFFGDVSIPDGVVLAAYDAQPGINNSASPTYIYASTFGGWINGSTFLGSNDAVLYPGESYVLVNNTATPITSLTISGEVALSNSRIRLFKDGAGAQDTRFSYVTPVSETLNEAGFVPDEGDAILYFNNSATGLNKSPSTVIYASAFGGWIDGSTFFPVGDTFTLEGGVGYIYRKSASAPISEDGNVVSDVPSFLQVP